MATSSTLSKTALITNNTNENNNNVVSAGIVGLRDVNHTIQDKRYEYKDFLCFFFKSFRFRSSGNTYFH